MGRMMGIMFGYINFVLLSDRADVMATFVSFEHTFKCYFVQFKKVMDFWEGTPHHEFVAHRLKKLSKRRHLSNSQKKRLMRCAQIML